MAISRLSVAGVVWSAAYLVMLAAIVATLVEARRQTLATLDTPQARAAWESWREAARREERRVPKSTEPPMLVLLRDYFRTCLAASLVFSSLLFFVLMFTLRGALGGNRTGRRQVTTIDE